MQTAAVCFVKLFCTTYHGAIGKLQYIRKKNGGYDK